MFLKFASRNNPSCSNTATPHFIQKNSPPIENKRSAFPHPWDYRRRNSSIYRTRVTPLSLLEGEGRRIRRRRRSHLVASFISPSNSLHTTFGQTTSSPPPRHAPSFKPSTGPRFLIPPPQTGLHSYRFTNLAKFEKCRQIKKNNIYLKK